MTFRIDFFQKKPVLAGLLFVGSFFLILISQAKAYTIENYQENVEDRFVISPVNLELNLAPGETTEQKMTVVNRLGKTAEFKLEKEDFLGSDDPEKSTVFLGDNSGGVTSAKDWITTEIEKISLNHGDRLTLNIKISVPKEAKSGSHYAGILVSVADDSKGEGDNMVKLVSRVGLLTLINVAGDQHESGDLTEFKTDRPFYRNGPVEFSTVFKNTGNVYQRVKGEISIRNFFGAEVARIPVKDWVVLSNASRRQKAEWSRSWLLGQYKAQINASYGFGDSQHVQKEIVFYAFPWHAALLALAILLVLFYLARYFLTKFEIRRKK